MSIIVYIHLIQLKTIDIKKINIYVSITILDNKLTHDIILHDSQRTLSLRENNILRLKLSQHDSEHTGYTRFLVNINKYNDRCDNFRITFK